MADEEQGFRRRQREDMWMRNENDDNDAATNDFASLEAMLASQTTSDNGTVHSLYPNTQQHNEDDDVLHTEEAERRSRNEYYVAPPSSPSTLSNDSVTVAAGGGGRVSPRKKKTKQQQQQQLHLPPPQLHNHRKESESKSRMHPPATSSTLSPPPSRTKLHHENLNSRQRPPKKSPTVAHSAKSIVGSRCVLLYRSAVSMVVFICVIKLVQRVSLLWLMTIFFGCSLSLCILYFIIPPVGPGTGVRPPQSLTSLRLAKMVVKVMPFSWEIVENARRFWPPNSTSRSW